LFISSSFLRYLFFFK
jgi:hypothetical protein